MAIWVNRSELIGTTSEIVGYKSGLGLTKEEYSDIVPTESHRLWFGDDDDTLRIYPEEFEELITHLLFKVGNIESPTNEPFTISLRRKYKDNKELLDILMGLFTMFIESLNKFSATVKLLSTPMYDPREFLMMLELSMDFQVANLL